MAENVMKQFRLTAEGDIFFQPDPTNPLPGKPVGRVTKGETLLQPCAIIEETAGIDPAQASEWLRLYIDETLQPLVALNNTEDMPEPAQKILQQMHDALGILPRAELEDSIAKLDETGRSALRARKVRLGPVLVFLPALNKPVAVRLRALLWTLWHDGALPAFTPPDGMTSLAVPSDSSINPLYLRAIGYPVYGSRAIRVDMLDRLIGAIYDSADKGVFRAKHEMAEWLGCTIPDLYAVLEAMDHKKLEDPAQESAEGKEEIIETTPALETDMLATPSETPATKDAPSVQEKPLLALFRLRRGKAYGRPAPHGQSGEREKLPSYKKNAEKNRRNALPDEKKERSFKEKRPRPEPRERIISAGPEKRMEDSPFAVLKNLKAGNKE